jgi:hypothetical protein
MSRAYQLAFFVVMVLALFACRSRDDRLARRAQDFEVVEEGSVAGVTSTISPPGEGPAPLLPPPPITDTNFDTTTSFTIIDPVTGSIGTAPPGTLADTLPQDREVHRPRPRPVPAQTAPDPTETAADPTQTAADPTETVPAPTQTALQDQTPTPPPRESPTPPPAAQEDQPDEKPAEDSSPPPTPPTPN